MREVQTLARGLEALAFLNAHAPATLAEVARHLDLPRANVDRLLRTLIAQGYCARLPNATGYIVLPGARRLSSGLQGAALLTAVGLPIVTALGEAIDWPVALAVPDGVDMRVLLSTDMTTARALLKTRPGFRTPMLLTTTGLLYLAFLPESERTVLLPAVLAHGRINPALGPTTLDAALCQARADGHLLLDRGFSEASLGVPLLADGRPLGGLVVRYMVRGIRRAEALAQFLPALRQSAEAIVLAASCID